MDELQVETEKRGRFVRPLQLMAVSVVMFVVSIPLCSYGGFNIESSTSSSLATFGVWVFLLSIPLFGISLLWLLIVAAFGSGDEPPRFVR